MALLLPEGAVGEEDAEFGIACFGGGESVDRQRRKALPGVALPGGVKEVHERQAVLRGDLADRFGVEREIGVFLGSVGKVALGGKVFEGDGRHEDDTGGGGAVVRLGERVLDPGVEFCLEVGDARRTVEGFVVAEERDDRVRLEVRQPLVGGGEESLAVVGVQFRVELVGTGEGPLRGARRMGTESGGVARAAHVADDEVLGRVAEVEFGLHPAVVHIAFSEAVSDEDNALAVGWRGHGLGAGLGGDGRFRGGSVGTVVGLLGAGRAGDGQGSDQGGEEFHYFGQVLVR